MKFKFTNLRLNAVAILFFAMSMAIFAQSTQCPTGMISYWKLDEADESATEYADAMGSHNATVEVAPDSITGIIGSARDFDGATDKVAVPSHTDFDFSSTTCFSIELWTKHTDVSFGTLNKVMIGRGDPSITGGKWWLGAAKTTGAITFALKEKDGTTEYSVAGPACNDGLWHHIAAIRDTSGNTIKLYIDGVLKKTASAPFTNTFLSGQNIQIGYLNKADEADPNVKYWYKGSLDDIAIYRRALSTAEVLDHYTKGMIGLGYCQGFAPEITSSPILSAAVGQLYTYNVDATGTEPITYTLLTKPSGMIISSTGLIEWTPESTSENGLVKVMVSNPSFPPADTQTFTINIAEAVVCPDNLIGLWSLDEKSGSIFADLYGNHAEVAVAPVPSIGIIGGAQTFSATSEVNIPDDGSFEWGKDAGFSIELWVKTLNNSSNVVALGRRDGSLATWWVGLNDAEKPTFYLKDAAGTQLTINASSSILDNLWHQIVAVYDGSANKAYLYLDGALQLEPNTSFTGGFTKSGGSVPVTIGWYNTGTGYHFIGEMDQIAIFNRALSSSEIYTFYNVGNPESHCKPGNYAPTFTSTPIKTAMDSVEYNYQVTATDANGDVLKYGATVLPTWLSIDTLTGLLSGTPETADTGNHTVTITVTDGLASPVSQTFTIKVVPYSGIPIITTAKYLATNANTALVLALSDFTVIDPDNNYPDDFTLIVLEGTNYTVSGTTITPAADFTGNLNVGVQVNDGSSNSNTYFAVVAVGPVSIDVIKENKINVYPNPAHDYIIFSMDEISNSAIVEIYNIQGILMTTQDLNVSNEVGLSEFSKGTYLYKVILENSNPVIGSLVIR